jgi:hypothetical protein
VPSAAAWRNGSTTLNVMRDEAGGMPTTFAVATQDGALPAMVT